MFASGPVWGIHKGANPRALFLLTNIQPPHTTRENMAQLTKTPTPDITSENVNVGGKDSISPAVHDELVAVDEKTTPRDLARDDAIQGEQAEQSMTLKESLRTYKRAILWSMAISLVIVMDGYDTGRE